MKPLSYLLCSSLLTLRHPSSERFCAACVADHFGRVATLVLVVLAFSAGCKSSEPAAGPNPDDAAADPSEQVRLADYEDFNPVPYRETPPEPVDLQHDVPASLLDGTVERGGTRTVQGFRIQVFFTQDKAAADQKVNEVASWWREQQQAGTLDEVYEQLPAEPPIYLVFRQPYYRVRIGNFTSRDQAENVLRLIERAFPDAFIAPDQVILMQ